MHYAREAPALSAATTAQCAQHSSTQDQAADSKRVPTGSEGFSPAGRSRQLRVHNTPSINQPTNQAAALRHCQPVHAGAARDIISITTTTVSLTQHYCLKLVAEVCGLMASV